MLICLIGSVSEDEFWRNYFYRVSLLRQSHELNAMANQQQSENPNQNLSTTDSMDHTQGIFIFHVISLFHRFICFCIYFSFFFLSPIYGLLEALVSRNFIRTRTHIFYSSWHVNFFLFYITDLNPLKISCASSTKRVRRSEYIYMYIYIHMYMHTWYSDHRCLLTHCRFLHAIQNDVCRARFL